VGHESSGQLRPGEVCETTDKGIVVAGSGGSLLIQKVRPEGEGKTGAAEFARNANLARGDRL